MAPPTTKLASRISINAMCFADVCWLLQEDRYSARELCAETGISRGAMSLWLKYLRRPERKLIYIIEWRRRHTRGRAEMIFKWGGHRDKPEPRVDQKAEEYLEKRRTKLALKHFDIVPRSELL